MAGNSRKLLSLSTLLAAACLARGSPSIAIEGNLLVSEGEEMSLTVIARSSDGGVTTLEADMLPSGTSFSTSYETTQTVGVLSWPAAEPVGAYTLGFSAHDSTGFATTAAAIRVTRPLTVHPDNPRYFTDGTGEAIFLSGAHIWWDMVDQSPSDPPDVFDFNAFLDELAAHGHNYLRLWTIELFKFQYQGEEIKHIHPLPWLRTGPGLALDGKPRFDLTQFDPVYFQRLRQRAQAAANRGIYVSVMLFEGHGIQLSLPPWCWDGHPFNSANNINGVEGDANSDGRGTEIHTLALTNVTAIQESFVRHVVDTVNDLDNILYEVANEAGSYSTDWQHHMISFIRGYEAGLPKQHPIGMTFQYKGGRNSTLFESPADWIAPNSNGGYRTNPIAGTGDKVVILDTDHLAIPGTPELVWKSLCRGLNAAYLDMNSDDVWLNLGYAKDHSATINLVAMTPQDALASSSYCLAHVAPTGSEYLVYLPDGGSVTVNLAGAVEELDVEWFRPATGHAQYGGTVTPGGARSFAAPFAGDAVLYLRSISLRHRLEIACGDNAIWLRILRARRGGTYAMESITNLVEGEVHTAEDATATAPVLFFRNDSPAFFRCLRQYND